MEKRPSIEDDPVASSRSGRWIESSRSTASIDQPRQAKPDQPMPISASLDRPDAAHRPPRTTVVRAAEMRGWMECGEPRVIHPHDHTRAAAA
ncbi:hypothetical protein [Longimicrobium terrae]|uniref:hypothetical protein n=1 Tax=Longimicrobium terrae TaxID=1639882 RepID=UPI00162274F0|nr:hypothetical protein [Longimicrobium terrae]MBB4639524.1 hypothetical protein [Longimicrobium terrae]